MMPAWYLQSNTNVYHTTCSWELSVADMYCYDMIIFQRHFEDKVKPLWEGAKDSGAIIVYETDDDFFNIRPANPAYKFIGNNEKQNVRDFMKMADAVLVSTNHLKDQMKCYNKNIYVMPNMIELNYEYLNTRTYNTDQIKIIYAGGPSHANDFQGVDGAIQKVMNDLGEKVKVFFIGWVPEYLREDSRIVRIPWLSIKEYQQVLASIQPDIGLAPLEHCTFNKSKSNVKWLEYTSVGAATIASDVLPFQEVITHGVNGVLVPEQRSRNWAAAITELVNNPDKIRSMATESVKVIEEKQLNITKSGLLIDVMEELLVNTSKIKAKKKEKAA
jgi:glycosyltransferase involved in cell wall biosynthesis